MFKYVFILLSGNVYADSITGFSESMGSLLIFPFLFVLMYFLLIRPQTKKIKEHKNLIENIKVNDEVFTQGGFLGKIKKISDQFVIISLNDNVDILIKKESIVSLLPKGTIKLIK